MNKFEIKEFWINYIKVGSNIDFIVEQILIIKIII